MTRVHSPFQLVGYLPSSAARATPLGIIIIVAVTSAPASAVAVRPLERRFAMIFLPEFLFLVAITSVPA
jgi:hypothetical protein